MKNRSSLLLIFITVFIDLIGFGILIPILPTIAVKDFNASEFEIGLLVAVFSFVQFIFNPFFGSVSDKKGRKPIIVFCLLLSGISYLIFAVAGSYLVLFLSRIVAGLGGSSISVAQAYVADITTKENRARGMGIIGAAFALGFVFGPLIGGFLSEYGIDVIGYTGASFSFIAFLITWFILPESLKEKSVRTSRSILNFKAMGAALKRPGIGIIIFVFFIITFSMSNIFGTFSLLGYSDYHLSDMQIGILFGIMGVFSAISQTVLINFLSKRFKEVTIISFGTLLIFISMILMPNSTNYTMLGIVSGVFTLGTGLLIPTSLSLLSKVTPDNEQGSILGINQSFSALGRVLGPLWGGFSFQFFGHSFPFLTGAFFVLGILLYSIFYLKAKIGLD
ncbi:MAG: MFS transporter [Ignavibacteriales bacterium]|nr:MAG: MFS transporter [Ignavibacteriales bacterium]